MLIPNTMHLNSLSRFTFMHNSVKFTIILQQNSFKNTWMQQHIKAFCHMVTLAICVNVYNVVKLQIKVKYIGYQQLISVLVTSNFDIIYCTSVLNLFYHYFIIILEKMKSKIISHYCKQKYCFLKTAIKQPIKQT